MNIKIRTLKNKNLKVNKSWFKVSPFQLKKLHFINLNVLIIRKEYFANS